MDCTAKHDLLPAISLRCLYNHGCFAFLPTVAPAASLTQRTDWLGSQIPGVRGSCGRHRKCLSQCFIAAKGKCQLWEGSRRDKFKNGLSGFWRGRLAGDGRGMVESCSLFSSPAATPLNLSAYAGITSTPCQPFSWIWPDYQSSPQMRGQPNSFTSLLLSVFCHCQGE